MILDIGLPGMDGYEVAQRLRQEGEPDPPLLIAVSGYGQESDRQKARESGFAYHFIKPVDVDQFDRTLRESLAG